jgi:hypothetical protein
MFVVYTEEELENFSFNATDATYFERAQDFKEICRTLRIKYLGLMPKKEQQGSMTITKWVQNKNKVGILGINREGVEANIRFLEARLGKHMVLSSWTEERMTTIVKDDMETWFEIMASNKDKYELSLPTANELRLLINDLLEGTYRRAIDNQERIGMIPISKEIKRLLGLDKEEERMRPEYSNQGTMDKLKKEMNY